MNCVWGAHRSLGGLAAREQRAIEFDEQRAPLAFLLLRRKFRGELLEDLAAALPQGAQLVEHQRRVRSLGKPQPCLQGAEHFLDAGRGALLLLDPILQAIDFFLQLPVGLLQFGAIAEQGENAMIILGIIDPFGVDANQAAELFDCFHVWRSGNRRPYLGHLQVQPALAGAKRWPRSTQYSSHLFSMMLRAQR